METGMAAELAKKLCDKCGISYARPQKAIRLMIPEVNPEARYRNEHISLQEIIEANC